MKMFLKYFRIGILVGIWILWSKMGTAQSVQFTDTSIPNISGLNVGRGASAWGDYNNDGVLELLVTGEDATGKISKLYAKDATGNYIDVTATAVPGGLPAVALGTINWVDYNNDGNLDFFITGTTGTTAISKLYTNSGAPNYTFAENTQVTFTGINQGAVAWGDFNNDGRVDLVFTGRTDVNATLAAPASSTLKTIKLYSNNGDGTFTDVTTALGAAPNAYISPSLVWADFNNDGYLDLLAGGYPNYNSVIYKNNGDGTFATPVNAGSNKWRNYSATVADFDKDGDLDIIAVGYDSGSLGGIRYFRNDGSLTFTDQSTAAGFPLPATGQRTGFTDASVSAGDYNNDGYPDFLFSSDNVTFTPAPITQVYVNNTNGTFTPLTTTQLPIGTGAATRAGTARWTDLDNDGLLDILLSGSNTTANYTTGTVKFFKNSLTVSKNTLPTSPSNLNYTYDPTTKLLTLTWDPATDAEQGNYLTYNLRVGTSPGKGDIVNPLTTSDNNIRKIAALGTIQPATVGGYITYYLKNLPNAKYYWSVQAIDNTFAAGAWATESQLIVGNDITPPSVATSNITIGSITTSSFTITNWTKGNGKKRVAFLSDVATDPLSLVNETVYPASTVFGTAAARVGSSSWYTVYNGTADGAIGTVITGLIPSKTYTLTVIEYNDAAAGGGEHYLLTGTTNTVSVTTMVAPPQVEASNILATPTNSHTATLSWTNGDGANRIVLIALGSPVVPTIQYYDTYTLGQIIGDWKVAYKGSGSSSSLPNLAPNQSYSILIYEYNGNAGDEHYLLPGSASVSFTTPKLTQQIVNFADIVKKYGDVDFLLTAQSSLGSNFPIAYSLVSGTGSDVSILNLDVNNVHIIHSGTVKILAEQSGNDTLAAATPLTIQLTIHKVPLVVSVLDTIIKQGSPFPSNYKASFAGFINNDDATIVNGTPSFALPNITTQFIGTVFIEASRGSLSAQNYYFDTFEEGKLIIEENIISEATNVSNNIAEPVSIYPNPVISGLLVIQTPGNGTVKVESINGVTVLQQAISQSSQTINLSSLSKGIYIVKFSNQEFSFVKRILKL